jgi:TonB family protein
VRFSAPLTALTLLASCTGTDRQSGADAIADTPAVQPPVALDPVPAIAYPEGVTDTAATLTVRLRLFVDEQGQVVADSTRVAESSGVAALDSAALDGASHLRYAPALRGGQPVSAAFVQPVEFTRP